MDPEEAERAPAIIYTKELSGGSGTSQVQPSEPTSVTSPLPTMGSSTIDHIRLGKGDHLVTPTLPLHPPHTWDGVSDLRISKGEKSQRPCLNLTGTKVILIILALERKILWSRLTLQKKLNFNTDIYSCNRIKF